MSTNANFFNGTPSFSGLLNPKDGTKPFWTRANESPENQGYDSDDDYTTDTRKLANFDRDTGEQVDKPLDTPDTRFVLQSYEPPVVDRQNRNVKVKNADTIISLLPEDDDYILIREDIMCKSHRFFEAGFRDLWSSKELDTEVDVDGCTIKYRYELEFHDDGTTSLNGKSSATPPVERTQNMQNAQNAVEENTVNNEVAQDMFDEYWLRLRFGANIMQHVNALRGHEYEFVCKAAHYLGFELLCGYPTKTCSRVIHNSPSDGFRGSRGFRSESQAKILIILKLVEWIHAYASFTVLEPQVERLILHSKFSEVAWEYPHTTLRITKLIKGEELFRLTLPHVVCNFDDPITDREPEFAEDDISVDQVDPSDHLSSDDENEDSWPPEGETKPALEVAEGEATLFSEGRRHSRAKKIL